jgi:hypothetical protein
MAVAPDAPRRPASEPARELENAVAEIGFRRGTKTDDRVARGEPVGLLRREMRRVDEAPARVDLHDAVDPLEWRDAMGRAALGHLARLLREVHVNRHGGIDVVGGGHDVGEDHRVHGAHRVRRDPEANVRVAVGEGADEFGDRRDVRREAPLAAFERTPTEGAEGVEDR